jgi:hypothetical protein
MHMLNSVEHVPPVLVAQKHRYIFIRSLLIRFAGQSSIIGKFLRLLR